MKKFAILLALLTGCVPIRHGGKNYQLVIGMGLVGVAHTNDVSVVSTKAIGLHAGDGRLNLGLSSVLSSSVPTNSNVIFEIRK